MQPPPIPDDEIDRLASLRRLRLLDTPVEARFDRITRLARHALQAPIALFSLVDEDRQWFKSADGLDTPETSRSVSFCGHAICGDQTFEVTDALHDGRFADNPLVTGELRLRHYAGRPVHAPDGARIGTLCIIGHEPRTLTAEEHGLLDDLAQLLENELQVESLNPTSAALRRSLDKEQLRSAVDPETRLWNRDYIFRILQGEFERAELEDQLLVVITVRIDPDAEGGRSEPVVVAERIARNLMRGDSLGRDSEHRFTVVLTQTNDVRLESLLAHLRESLKRAGIPAHLGWTTNLTSHPDAAAMLQAAQRMAEERSAE